MPSRIGCDMADAGWVSLVAQPEARSGIVTAANSAARASPERPETIRGTIGGPPVNRAKRWIVTQREAFVKGGGQPEKSPPAPDSDGRGRGTGGVSPSAVCGWECRRLRRRTAPDRAAAPKSLSG